MKNIFLLIVFLQSSAFAQTPFNSTLKELSNDIAVRMQRISKKKIAVIDLTEINKAQTTAGRYIADIISINLSNDTSNFKLYERQNLDKIMSEIKLSSEGYIDEATAKQLGKLTGADVIVSGNYTVLSHTITVTLKIFETESGFVVGGSIKDIPIDEDTKTLLGLNSSGSRGFNSPVQTGENYNSPIAVNKDCATKNIGDVCFENKTNLKIKVGLYEGTTAGWGAGSFKGYISIAPGQVQCFYELGCKVHHYSASKDVANFYEHENFISEGNVMIEQCKSKTNVIF